MSCVWRLTISNGVPLDALYRRMTKPRCGGCAIYAPVEEAWPSYSAHFELSEEESQVA
jgi:hypothetical protein